MDKWRILYARSSKAPRALSFGEFLTLLQILKDEDFAGIKTHTEMLLEAEKPMISKEGKMCNLGPNLTLKSLVGLKRQASWARMQIEMRNKGRHDKFLGICAKRKLSKENFENFSEDEVTQLDAAFESCPSFQELSSALLKIDWHTTVSEEQGKLVKSIIDSLNRQEVDTEKEAFSFKGFVEGARKLKQVTARLSDERENKLIAECKRSDMEIACFRALFDQYQDANEGFGLGHFHTWIESISLSLCSAEQDEVVKMFEDARKDRVALYKHSLALKPNLSFGEFLSLISTMMTSDFAHVKSKKLLFSDLSW